ncbi:Uncharacterised protein [Collinsella intestinalis]|nr:Uncharacterised protein [Collinsella intestinalis]
MHVAGLVVRQAAARVGLLNIFEFDWDGRYGIGRGFALATGPGKGGLARQLERGERAAPVTGGECADRANNLITGAEAPVEPLRCAQGTADQALDVLIGQVLELHDAAARQQR